MFTKSELNVLSSALRNWEGPYTKDDLNKLSRSEKDYYQKSLNIADNLATRFEEILEDYYQMENSHLVQLR